MASDVLAKAVMVFEGDTSDLKEKLRDLQGEERKLAEAQLKAAQARNAQLEQWSAGLTKIAGVARVAFEGMAAGVERARLSAAAGATNIDALRQASAGLVKETDLLRFAAQARAGALKADNELLEAAQKAMRALTQQGFEYTKVSDKVTEAIVKGETDGLKDLGIIIRKTTTDAERHAAIKEKLIELANKATGANVTEAESAQAAMVSYEDSIQKVKESLGELAIALAPIVKLAADLVGWTARLVMGQNQGSSRYADQARLLSGAMTREEYDRKWADVDQAAPGVDLGAVGSADVRGLNRPRSVDATVAAKVAADQRLYAPGMGLAYSASDNSLEEAVKRRKEREEADKRRFGEAPKLTEDQLKAIAKAQAEVILSTYRSTGGNLTGDRISVGNTRYNPLGGIPTEFGAKAVQVDEFGRPVDDQLSRMIATADRDLATARWNDGMSKPHVAGSGIAAAQDSQLAKVFGPLSEFNAYQQAFGALTGAVGSAMGAWIDGSKSAGEAFKAFIGEALKGVAIQMAIESVKHAAFAIGHAAFGDISGATKHGAAAAAFAAGAVVAGAGAKLLGGGGDAGAGAGGGRPSAPYTGGSGSESRLPENKAQIIVIGNSWNRQSPRTQALEATEVAELAGTGGGG